jgi:hypothetical protein
MALVCTFLLALWAAPGFAQQSINSGSIRGHVEDASGAAIAKAAVRLTNTERNQTTTLETDSSGRFSFAYLPVGDYEIRAEREGFQTEVRKARLSIGQSLDIPIVLTITGVEVAIKVTTDNTPTLEPLRTQMAETILPDEIAALPLSGRNYLDLALLAPATSKTNTGNNERFAETSAVAGTGISVAGQRNLGNGFLVDGLSANDDAADLALTFFSQEVIREFQVVRSGGVAEFGRAYAGVINVVTQSGTNDWRETLYGFFRNHRFDAVNVFAPVDSISGKRRGAPLTQAQYGASAGGPLKRNRAFLFTNFEREDLNRSGFITISPSNVDTINTRLDEIGYAAPRLTTGAYPTGDNRTSFLARTDLEVSARTRASFRYSLYDIFSPNARGVGGLSAVSRATHVSNQDHTIALNVTHVLSSNAVTETRFQMIRSRFEAPGTDLVGPAINISGLANFGASTSAPTGRDIDLLEIGNNFSVQRGRHTLKAGANFIYNRVDIEFPATIYGTYNFSNMAGFLTGAYTSFGQAFGKIDWYQTNPNLGWFVQDEWRIRRDLTINAGLRQDVEWLIDPIATQWRTFSPRLGLSWAPGNRKTVIRSSFGLYYDRISLRAIANAQRGDGTEYQAISLQRSQSGAPVFPNKLAAVPSGVLLSLSTIDPNIKAAYGIQSSLEIEREIGSRLSVSVGYLRMRGVHIIMQRNLNVPTLTAAEDPVNLGRPNPNFGNINQYSGQGDSYYDGLTVSLERRGAGSARFRLAYTYSKAIDNTGNAFFSSPQDHFDLRDNRGLSDNDQRHRLTVSGQFSIPRPPSGAGWTRAFEGFQLSPIFSYGSPYPFNIVTGGQTIQTTPARPSGVGRNTGKGFNAATLDVRLSRNLHVTDRTSVELLAESFNVLNRTNLQFPNNTWGTGSTPIPTFGLPTAAGDPRQLQFGVRLKM